MTCWVVDGLAVCDPCPEGFVGDAIGPNGCLDVDECAVDHGGCGDPARWSCLNQPGGPPLCVDVDECAQGTAGCDLHAACTNTEGGFECACQYGYEGDGLTCQPDPCIPNPCFNENAGQCIPTDEGPICCPTGPGCDGFTSGAIANGRVCGIRTDGTLICWGSAVAPHSVPEGSFTKVAVFDINACAIRTDGSLACWGADYAPAAPFTPYDPPGTTDPPLGSFTEIAVGWWQACGLLVDQTLLCWNHHDGTSSPSPEGSFASVAAGNEHFCALALDGAAFCWGEDGDGQASPPTGTFQKLALAGDTTCGLRPTGVAECWGAFVVQNEESIVPAGPVIDVSVAIADGIGLPNVCVLRSNGAPECGGWDWFGSTSPRPGEYTLALSGGFRETCALRPDGAFGCWGDNHWNQAVPPEGSFDQVAVGSGYACALRDDRTLACWGGGFERMAVPAPPPGEYLAVGAGQNDAYAIRLDGALDHWPAESAWGPPGTVTGSYVALAVGGWHACAVRDDLEVRCVGGNSHGQLDAPPGPFVDVVASYTSSCGLRPDGHVECWGNAVAPSGTFASLEDGRAPFCGLTPLGEIECWPWADGADAFLPPSPSGTYEMVSAAAGRACAVDGAGTLTCWGPGPWSTSKAPAGSFRSVSVGLRNNSCAIRTDGTLACWGAN